MTEIGQYLIGKSIGEGTFGKVCKALHQVLGHEVAVKILEKKRIVDDQDVERVKREITILQMLHHPQVVQLYEIIETEAHIYLFMEYAGGGELFDYIDKSKRINEIEACKLMHQIIAAVQYIHEMHIVHRDLKPENLLLTSLKDILVVDFGLSNIYEDTLKTACGSPCYAAPEMILGHPYHGLQTDLWSCGVIMYAMLCGYLPFEDNNTQVLYKKILNAEFHIPRFVSLDAKNLLKAILCVDPTKRLTLEQIKQHKWWQLWKQENPPMDAFKAQYHTISNQFLPNSIYAQCNKQKIKRDISEDVKTCDTGQVSFETQWEPQQVIKQEISPDYKLEIQDQVIIEEREKEDSPMLIHEEELPTANDEQLNIVDIKPILKPPSLRSVSPSKLSPGKSPKKYSYHSLDAQSPLKIPSFQQLLGPAESTDQKSLLQESLRSLTRQQSLKSIQSIKQLEDQQKQQIIDYQSEQKQQSSQQQQQQQQQRKSTQKQEIQKQNKTVKPAMPSGYKKPQTIQVRQRNKQGPSKSLHEAPPAIKVFPTPITPKAPPPKALVAKVPVLRQPQKQMTIIQEQQKEIKTPKTMIQQQKSQQRQVTVKKQDKTPIRKIEHNRFPTQIDETFNQFEDVPLVEQFKYHLNNKLYPNKQKISQEMKGIEIHTGPIHTCMVSHKHPKMLFGGIQKYLGEKYQQNIVFNQQQEQFGMNFSLMGMHIEIKLRKMDMVELLMILINSNKRDQEEFIHFMEDLHLNFKF